MSQKKHIREALLRGEPLTRLDCLQRFGCFEAGARVTELRQEGMDIVTDWGTTPDGKRYAIWSLAPSQPCLFPALLKQ